MNLNILANTMAVPSFSELASCAYVEQLLIVTSLVGY